MFCRKCGTQIDDNVSFCPKCGTKAEVDSGASQEFRTYAPMWSRQEDEAAQKPVEPKLEPAKKKNGKKTGLIIGITIGLVVAIIAVVVILFATFVFDNGTGDKDDIASTSEKAETNVEFKTVTVMASLYDEDYNDKGEKEITIQIPCFKEFDRYDFDESKMMLSDEVYCIYGDNGVFVALNYGYGYDEVVIGINYKSDNFKISNINYGSIVAETYDNEIENASEIYFRSYDEVMCYHFSVDNDVQEGFTESGYKCESGVFYDNNGNEVSEGDFWQEFRDTYTSVDRYFYW